LELGKDKEHPVPESSSLNYVPRVMIMLMFMSGFSSRFLGPRARHGRRTHPFRIRTCARCRQVVVIWCRLPRSRARSGRGGRRGVSAPAVTRPCSQLYGVRAFGWIGSVHQQNKRKIPRPLIFGRAERESRPRICVCVPKWMVSRPFTEILTGTG
jgi:hypothetical protein